MKRALKWLVGFILANFYIAFLIWGWLEGYEHVGR